MSKVDQSYLHIHEVPPLQYPIKSYGKIHQYIQVLHKGVSGLRLNDSPDVKF